MALAEICAKCERYIGTEGGGMDQSISFLAEPGKVRLLSALDLRHYNPPAAQDSAEISLSLLLSRIFLTLWVFVCQAKLIEFQPLRATDVKLPDGAVFVISNCCVEMNKAASSHFNIRVVECRIAAKVGVISSRSFQLHLTVTLLCGLSSWPGLVVWTPASC